eukprot:TRINITY_DN1607_c0_g1_i1.p1 TRINITY_DN1607_c0_g1~~TRINITY_DN1607_c0_g1_i1.p1  ORF type:complete len:452 (-),score=92.27 TRINITY_DN1607_c0_g1_i1:654-1877(-)
MAAAAGQGAEKKALVPIAHGTEEMEAVILIDILRRAGADVTVGSVETTKQVTASRTVKLVADVLIEDCASQKFDVIVLPGGMPGAERLRDSKTLRELTTAQAEEERLFGAICAAPAVALGPWGLLKGRQVTAHPNFVDKLEDTSSAECRVVTDGYCITSRGPGTAMEYALAIVERLFGKERADAVAKPMVIRSPDGTETLRQEFGVEIPFQLAEGGPPKVLVPIANGSEEMEAVIIIDVLRRGGANVVVASVEDQLQISASRGVKIVADCLISGCANSVFDLIVLPGGMPGAERLRDNQILSQLLKRQAESQRLYAAICAAPAVVLQPKGLLDGRRATAHPAFANKLVDRSAVGTRVVSDGIVLTSRGPGTAMEFALALVERLFGSDHAAQVARPMVIPRSVLPITA